MQPRERFIELVSRPEEEIPLAEVALWIAAESRPGLDVAHYLTELSDLAERIRPLVESGTTEDERIALLNRALFELEGFRGNQDDYPDPLNSFLDAVLDRRLGIPITLCIVYIEVARRLGLDAAGIGFPGHFLARIATPSGPVIVDAFFGRLLGQRECEALLRQAMGDEARLTPAMLEAAAPSEIVRRVLRNLKQLWVASKEFERALECCDRILFVSPDDPIEVRDRGLIYQYLECHAAALQDLQRFLELSPDDPSATTIEKMVEDLRLQVGRIH